MTSARRPLTGRRFSRQSAEQSNSFLPRASDRSHLAGRKIDFPQQVVFRVGYIQVVVDNRHSLRMIETAGIESAVRAADLAGSDDMLDRSSKPGHNDAIVIAVGDEKPPACFIG